MTHAHIPASRTSANPHPRLHSLLQPAQQGLLLGVLMLCLATTAQAAGSSMPW